MVPKLLFSSFELFVFITVVYFLTFLLGPRLRWVVLLLASYLFYASLRVPYLLVVLVLVTLVSYCSGLAIANTDEPRQKKIWLWAGISVNLLPLVVLKYTGFLAQNVAGLLEFLGAGGGIPINNPFVSIGVSFYVFQAISYLLDVYFEVIAPERHLGLFALYLALFAKLIQGPIERAEGILPQLHSPGPLRAIDLREGLLLFAWGLFKKVVIADRLAVFVNVVYNDIGQFAGLPLLLATYLFAAQLYLDFSGYTDMARGIARLFGINLTENFNAPYFSTSVIEFWRRWHISFSSWILDYIFKPMQLELRDWGPYGTSAALMVTFLVSGIWHGATWGFVVWGLLHGLFIVTSVFYKPWQVRFHKKFKLNGTKILKGTQIVVTFQLVCLAWVFFRAASLNEAVQVVVRSITGLPGSLIAVWRGERLDHLLMLGQSPGEVVLVCILLTFITAAGTYKRLSSTGSELPRILVPARSPWVRTVIAGIMFYLIAFHGAENQSFIYAQF